MGYQFNGFLTANSEAADTALRRWDFCEAKRLDDQFDGFIVRCPNMLDLHPLDGEDAAERLLTQIDEVKAGLAALSAQFPEAFIVYIEVDCFGGVCMHQGMHLQCGEVVAAFSSGKDEVDLATLLQPLGVRLNEDQFFSPLTRGFFQRDQLQSRSASPVHAQADTSGVEVQLLRARWWQFWRR
ncbi:MULTISPECIES: hypothetical protein [Variovorax]|jgi:hypothetical protein|uniref:hypothetical protein n=1 Tax=Variovorax TaxID=34072 RepID=UPI00086BD66D|nr:MULTISPECIES: hypothetical protein [Variovorax]MBN8758544.1 hypothetical protein [Variovorax sp.]ODU18818.1 MAG: hypothetical protein ABS94_02915 [Variovorax sp. SCN 67-85]ODV17993.1 MAG: hypothetical protein ABT25_28775 [Variovorax sp. SCN 67-20]OJZ05701.1 MAG: hypothetical protein BGP22_22150 [Variovorax sp. 67-131]UKI07579.1 hypothetical protein L3V85_33080 [Variovorax paradoxus]